MIGVFFFQSRYHANSFGHAFHTREADLFYPATHPQPPPRTSITFLARKINTMRSTKLITATLAVVGTPVSAFWRMECRGVSGQARLDPLMAYGEIGAGHVHEIFGGSGKPVSMWKIVPNRN